MLFRAVVFLTGIVLIDGRRRFSSDNEAPKYPEDCSKCGISIPKPTVDLMMFGSKPVDSPSTYPWMVSLRQIPLINLCGGAILSDSYILTAAHCVEKDGDLQYSRKVHFQTSHPKQLSKGYDIEKIILHPRYRLIQSNATDVLFADYDIALIKLKKKIKCNEYRNPICLPPDAFQLPYGAVSKIAGWGQKEWPIERTLELHHGGAKHLRFSKCVEAVPETKMVKESMFCAGDTQQTPCYGDSGSPLVHEIDKKFSVVGITSSETDTNCVIGSPTIYTNVAKRLSWIEENMGKVSIHPQRASKQTVMRRRYKGRGKTEMESKASKFFIRLKY